MRNSLCPGYIKILYSRTGVQHSMTFGLKYDGVPTVGAEPTVVQKDATTSAVGLVVSSLITLLKPFFTAAITFTNFECWYKATSTSDPVYIYGNDIVGGAGNNVGPMITAGQLVISFRTQNHGIYRMYLMDDVMTVNQVWPAPNYSANAGLIALHNFVTGNDSFIYGRDDSFPASGINATSKINDVLRRRYLV